MRTARLYSFGDIRIEDEPVPDVGPYDALIKTKACGICSGDVMPWYIEKNVKRACQVVTIESTFLASFRLLEGHWACLRTFISTINRHSREGVKPGGPSLELAVFYESN